MTASTNVPYWIVALRVGCVLSQVIAASGDLSLKLSLTPEHKFTNNGLPRPQGGKFRSDVKITAFLLKFGFTLSRKL